MIYNIPDELAPYLEYIPEDMLSDVITDALRAAIFAAPVCQETTSSSNVDMSQLLEQIKGLIGTDNIAPITQEVTKENDVTTLITTTTVTEGVDEDLQDIVAGFTNNLFK